MKKAILPVRTAFLTGSIYIGRDVESLLIVLYFFYQRKNTGAVMLFKDIAKP